MLFLWPSFTLPLLPPRSVFLYQLSIKFSVFLRKQNEKFVSNVILFSCCSNSKISFFYFIFRFVFSGNIRRCLCYVLFVTFANKKNVVFRLECYCFTIVTNLRNNYITTSITTFSISALSIMSNDIQHIINK
jgi:hypothetical protein